PHSRHLLCSFIFGSSAHHRIIMKAKLDWEPMRGPIERYKEGTIGSLAELRDIIEKEVGIVTSTSTLQRFLRGTWRRGRSRRNGRKEANGSDEAQSGRREGTASAIKKKCVPSKVRISGSLGREDAILSQRTLSRCLNETILTVEADGGLRQYAQTNVSVDGRTVNYRCNNCIRALRKGGKGPVAKIKTTDGEIVGDGQPKHADGCAVIEKRVALVRAVDRECRREVRLGRKAPQAAHIDGFEKILTLERGLRGNALTELYPSWMRVRRSLYAHRMVARAGSSDGCRQSMHSGRNSFSDSTEMDESTISDDAVISKLEQTSPSHILVDVE
uniref:RYYR-CCHC domain-containing protein n=1 Tax=Parascaris univalens TaxID=6257 RepID=A0A915BCI9_PARUN